MGDFLSLTNEEKERTERTIGRLTHFIKRELVSSHDQLTQARAQLAKLLEVASDEKDAISKLQLFELEDSFGDRLQQSNVQAALGGILFVQTVETENVALQEDGIAFFDMPFEEAIEFFRNKDILTPEEFEALTREEREAAFTAKRLFSQRLRERTAQELLKALERGETIADFIERVRDAESDLGIEPSQDHYLENVFRTNTMQAYSAGKRQAAFSETVKQARPYIVIRATLDGRTRASHRAMHNKAFSKNSGLSGRLPPWSYNCRCSFVSMDADQIADRDIEIITEYPTDIPDF